MISLSRFPTCRSWSRLCWVGRGHAAYSDISRPPKYFKPLRILFCGSDEFSVVSLRKLVDKSCHDPAFIQSVDVVCKRGKPSGRGLKTTRDVEIKRIAQELSVPLHEIPTFTGWSSPLHINLILAVSFGLFVPPRLLNQAEYGGLNLHPSLLPELRGPAPLQHTLMMGKQTSGLTLQTLDPEHFDRGIILAQETYRLPKDGACDLSELQKNVAELASDFLVENLRHGVFVHPLEDKRFSGLIESQAPKIGPDDAHIDWRQCTSERVLCVQRAITPLWSRWEYSDQKSVRVQFNNLQPAAPIDTQTPGRPGTTTNYKSTLGIWTADGQLLAIEGMTVEGRKKNANAITEMAYLQKLGPQGRFM